MAKIYLAKSSRHLTSEQMVEMRGIAEKMKRGLVALEIDDIGLFMEVPEEIAAELRMLLYLRLL